MITIIKMMFDKYTLFQHKLIYLPNETHNQIINL